MAYCSVYKESPDNLVLGHFSVILQPRSFCKVRFCDTSSAGKTTRKITKILQSFHFQLNLNHSDSHGALDSMNFQKWELFSGSPDTLPEIYLMVLLLAQNIE